MNHCVYNWWRVPMDHLVTASGEYPGIIMLRAVERREYSWITLLRAGRKHLWLTMVQLVESSRGLCPSRW